MPVNKFQTRYKYKRNLKNFELKKYVQDFKTLPISLVYSFDNPNDQLDTLEKLILNEINENAPLTKTKFMRPTAPWIKDFEIKKLEKEKTTGGTRLIASKHFNHGNNSEKLGQNQKGYQQEKDKFLQKSVSIEK